MYVNLVKILRGNNTLSIIDNIFTIEEIEEILPHRYPLLLIDGIYELKKNKFIRAFKKFSKNDFFSQGHFPKKPIYPGVLVLESMAQAAAILVSKSIKKFKIGKLFYLVRINNTRFRSSVFTGDIMIININLQKLKKNLVEFNAISMVKEKLICESTMVCMYK